jgi:hypothetical protein
MITLRGGSFSESTIEAIFIIFILPALFLPNKIKNPIMTEAIKARMMDPTMI